MTSERVLPAILALAGCALAGEVRVVEGVNAAVSADGRRIAFQRAEGGQSHLAVMDLGTGATTWLVRGATENACHPAWGRDGSLVYSYANITNTAYRRFRGKGGPQDGYGLRIWKDGVTRELTHGLWRDFSPSLSPDCTKVYLCTQKDMKGDGDDPYARIDELDLATGARREVFAPRPDNAAVGQPVVSPDGRLIAWAQIAGHGGYWFVCAARRSDPSVSAVVNPLALSAYAPNWSPDGRFLVYTGFTAGDDGWQVYVTELASGDTRRICRGENASFTPDGKGVVYDLDGVVYRRALAAADLPSGRRVPSAADEPEKVLVTFRNPASGENLPLDPACSFGRKQTAFLRARIRWDGDISRYQHFLNLKSGGVDDAFRIYISKNGVPHVAVKDTGGVNFSLPDMVDADLAKKPGEIVLTGIRTATDLFVSVNGRPAVRRSLYGGCAPLDRPETCSVGRGMNPTTKIELLEIGTGWPVNVPRPLEGKDLVK